ncbi:MAG: RNA polymerase sigma factor, partial [Candidatus Dormibacteraceae bacterium]
MPINLLLDQTDPPLIKRARCYERGALEELFNRNIDTVYVLAYALSGETAAAEQIAEAAFVQTLAKLHRFSGDGRGFGAWVLRLAATMIRRSGGEEGGIRSDYVRLSAQLKEILALRIFGGLDCERIAYLTHRPIPDVRLRLVEALRRLGQGNRRGSEENLQSFDQAVSRVLTEPLPESFELSAPDDARELLAIAYTLADLPRQPLPTEARLRLRSAFIAASSSHRALWA